MSYPHKTSLYKHGSANLSKGEDNFIDQFLTMDD